MKTKYLIPFAGLSFLLASCVNDLDVKPLDKTVVTGEEAYSDPESYTKALMKIYSVWCMSGQDGEGSTDIDELDAGNAQLLRTWWTLQEQTTDECKNAWPDPWVGEINAQTWSDSKLEPIEGLYQRCMFIVALSNEYLKNVSGAPAHMNPEQLRAEARFCRALAYYALLDAFGNPPFITEANYSINPAQIGREALFNWIVTELKDCINHLPAALQGNYGRADQGAANALLARLYLNAEVYTGTPMYTECITACKNVIAGGYGLASNYADLFKADNGQNTDTRQEIIFPICFDGAATKTWGGMTALICGSRGSKEVKLEVDGVNQGWDGYRSTQNLVELFEFLPGEKTAATIADKRGIFYSENRSIEIKTAALNTFTTEGWAVYKYTNMKSDGTPGSDEVFPDTDFPFFRLAEIYLTYAEAVARGGQGGDMGTAVKYINDLRDRAFGDNNHQIDAAWLSANSYRNLLDERGRELYWECVRRTDLIRYGLYTSSSYVWPLKGGVITGVGIDDYRGLFPIPMTDLTANANLDQNPGYAKK